MRQKKMLHILEMLVVCALGITLILSPRRSLDAALTILGIALLAGGVIAVGYYFFTRHKASEGQQPMFIALAGCVAVVAGLVVILAPNLLTQVFRFVAGILVAFSGILNLVKALEARKEGKKGWQILLALSIIAIAMGILVFINPFRAESTLVILVGAVLIYNGILGIVTAIRE